MLTDERVCGQRAGDYACVAKADPDDDHSRDQKLWVPLVLRRSTMIVLLFSSLSILAALVALFVVTHHSDSHGIKTDGDRYYYLWTYGPTAVFTILTAGWLQVEYRATQLMPWFLMFKGPTPASESVLLDYISKWNVISLYQSLKQKHFLVSLAVAGSLILNGITVFSTGLFELNQVPITRSVRMTIPKSFNTTGFDPSRNNALSYATCSTIAIRNTSRAFGIHEPYVYTPFLPKSSDFSQNEKLPAGINYQANTELVEPFIECQNATVSLGQDHGKNTIKWSTPDGCHYQLDEENTRFINLLDTLFYLRGCRGDNYSLSMSSTEVDSTDEWAYTGPLNQSADWRLWVAVVGNSSDPIMNTTSRAVPLYHVVSCKARYNLYRGPVRIWRDVGRNDVSAEIDSQKLSNIGGFPNIPAANILYSAFQGFKLAQRENLWDFDGLQMIWLNDSFTGHPGGFSEKDWSDMARLIVPLKREMLCLMRQTILNGMIEAGSQQVEGTEQSMEGRLFVRPLSFWLIASLIVCLINIEVILLCFFVPISVSPRDLASIGGMSTVFAESPEFMALFEGSDLKTEEQMASHQVGRTQYTSKQIDGRFTILAEYDLSQGDPESKKFKHDEEENNSLTWWLPFSSSWFARIPAITLPLAVIIALEVVYHISTSSQGITLVDGKSSYIHYIWAYIPALIMFIIRCFFSSIEFGARIIQPYSQLREGSAPLETTIFENQLRKIAVFGVFDTLRKKQWALAAATTSLILAAVNPIAVSGLYTVKPMGRTFPVNIAQETRWNLGNTYAEEFVGPRAIKYAHVPDLDNGKTAGLIIQNNLSDPDWTYKNLAFPRLALSSNNLPQNGSIDVRIPALRSRLTCSQIPDDQLDCETEIGTEQSHFWCFMKAHCFPVDPHYNEKKGLGISRSGKGNSSSTEYFVDGSKTLSNPQNRDKGCPTHQIIYGRWAPEHGIKDYYYLRCMATIEEVDTETRLQLPSQSIDTDLPPRVIPGTNRTIFNASMIPYPGISDLRKYLFQTDVKLNDHLLDALVSGVDGVPMRDLLDPSTLVERMNQVWGIAMAQLINANGRETFYDNLNTTQLVHPATSHTPTYEGTFNDGRRYLVQNKISTRILDGVLASMVICAIIALYMMRTKEVLPKSPCSIASVASLVVGSRFLKSMKGTEWCTEKEMRERGLFESTFAMGWWKFERDTMSTQPANSNTASDAPRPSGTNDDEVDEEVDSGAEGHLTEITQSSTNSDSTEEKVRAQTRFGIDMEESTPLLDYVQRSSVEDRGSQDFL